LQLIIIIIIIIIIIRMIIRKLCNAQYTPPTQTRPHPSAVVTQFTISCSDKWRHNDVIVEKVIKIHEYYTTQLIRIFTNMQRHMLRHILLNTDTTGCRFVNWVTADGCVQIDEYVGSRRELVANSCTHRRRDATRQFRCVGGVYWALCTTSSAHELFRNWQNLNPVYTMKLARRTGSTSLC